MESPDQIKQQAGMVRLTGPDPSSLVGSVIAGKYEIISFLGEGGMSSVFKAKDLVINRTIALKILLSLRSADERAILRFTKEAMAAGRLDHRNIVRLYDVGTHEDGTPYLVMDFVEGETLSQLIQSKGALSIADALSIFIQVCDALEHAHQAGVVHRDIKPSNLLISVGPDNALNVKILDFGIAKVLDEALSAQQATRTGEIFGSPLYMSPEQATGAKVDHRSDIYSTACALFEALTGLPPHVGESTLQTIMKHQTEAAPTLRDASIGAEFPAQLEEILAKGLSKKPKERFQTMTEFGNALSDVRKKILAGEKFDTVQSSKQLPAAKKLRSQLTPIVYGVSAIIVGVVAYSIGDLSQRHHQQTQSPVPAAVVAPVAAPVVPPSTQTSAETSLIGMLPEEGELTMNSENSSDQYVADMYKANPNSDSLRLRGFHLSRAGLATIAKFKSLCKLNMTSAKFDDTSPEFKAICKLPLRDFSVTNGSLTNVGLQTLLKMPNLVRLQVGGCLSLTDNGLKNIGPDSQLQNFDGSNCQFTDRAIRYLSNAEDLKKLNLAGNNRIVGKTFPLIARLNLDELYLNHTDLGDDAIRLLGNCPMLRVLDLSKTKITDASAAAICKLKRRLRVLVLNNTAITDKSIKEFSQELNLRQLRVEGCSKVDAEALSAMHALHPDCDIFDTRHPARSSKEAIF